MTWQEYQPGIWESDDERWRIVRTRSSTHSLFPAFDVHERVDRHALTLRQKNLASLDAAIEWIGGKDD